MPNPPHPLPHKPRIRHAFDQAAANYFWELRYAFHDLDRCQHVLNIADPAHLLAACAGGAWRLHHWQRQPVRRYYRDLRGLLRHVKAGRAMQLV